MPIDTSMYQQPTQSSPLTNTIQMLELRNAMGNVNKMKGGTPGTTSALDQLGAGQAYGSGS